jgi:hypothetical protein
VEKGEGGFFIPLNCFACTFQPILALLEKNGHRDVLKSSLSNYYAFYRKHFFITAAKATVFNIKIF